MAELICDSTNHDCSKRCNLTSALKCYSCTSLADHLIANGVTVQKWNSAKTPPKDWKGEGGYLTNYYVYTPDYGVDIGNYMGAANRWLCMGMPCNVTHWMPMPEPPKEE